MSKFDVNQSLQNGIDRLAGYLPELIGAILLLLVGYFVAIIIRTLVRGLLKGIHFDGMIESAHGGAYVTRVLSGPTNFLSKVAYWIVFLWFVSLALSALNISALNQFITGIYAYIPNIIAAVIIFLVASLLAAGSAAFVKRLMSGMYLASVLSAILPSIILGVAAFMILDQLKIAHNIIIITYSAIMGSLALGLALAFGLGGREVASRMLSQAYDTGQQKVGEVAASARNSSGRRRAAMTKAQTASVSSKVII